MSSLPVRLASAFFAIAALFATKEWGGYEGLFTLTGLIITLGFLEFFNFFSEEIRKDSFFRILFVVTGSLVYWSSYFSIQTLLFSFFTATISLMTYLILRIRTEEHRPIFFNALSLSLLGVFYCALSPAIIALLLKRPHGTDWLVVLLAIVFVGDSLAFFSGYFFGKKKLHPMVSPKKTWAGSVGGVLGSIVAGYGFCYFFLPPAAYSFHILWIAALTGCAGQVGDLFESLLKRVTGVKDSGKIMPGHGGVLDRIDGVLFAGPLFCFLVQSLYF